MVQQLFITTTPRKLQIKENIFNLMKICQNSMINLNFINLPLSLVLKVKAKAKKGKERRDLRNKREVKNEHYLSTKILKLE